MKRFLLRMLAFMGMATVAYVLLMGVAGDLLPMYLRKNLSYRAGAYGHMYSRMKEAQSVQNVDVLILGSSHAYRGFDPRIFAANGVAAFNMGSSSQTPIQTQMLMEKYLGRMNPRQVILEVYPGMFGLDGVESSLDLVANDGFSLAALKMVFRVNHTMTYNAAVYSWLRQLTGTRDDFREPVHMGKDTYIPGGYVERQMEHYEFVSHPPETLAFIPGQQQAFDACLAMLKSRKIPYVLVQAPVTRSYYSSMVNRDEADEWLRSRGPYFNFNMIHGFNDSLHFYDRDHLNQEGVKLFNNKLIELIFNTDT